MKSSSFHFFKVAIIILFAAQCSQAQDMENKITPMLKQFYITYNKTWYVGLKNYPTELKNKLNSLEKTYCTENMRNKLQKIYNNFGIEHAYLLDDVVTDTVTFKNTLAISKDTIMDNGYIVSFDTYIKDPYKSYKEKIIIHLTVKEENGSYKIDGISE